MPNWLNRAKANISDMASNPTDYTQMVIDRLRNRNERVQPTIAGGELTNRPLTEEEIMQQDMELAMSVGPGVIGKGSEGLFASVPRLPDFKSRSTTVNMPITKFLENAEALEQPSAEKLAAIREVLRSGRKLETTPALYMRNKEGVPSEVMGHEGRHRALALQEEGYTHMPVELRGDIRWDQQSNPNSFDYRTNWPAELVGQQGKKMPFPLRREQTITEFPEVWE